MISHSISKWKEKFNGGEIDFCRYAGNTGKHRVLMEHPHRQQNKDMTWQGAPGSGRVERWIGSARMAVVLVSLTAAACALGTIIPQGREPSFYTGACGNTPGKLITALFLDNLFYAPWFICLLMLVAINLAVSNWNRFKKLMGDGEKAPPAEDFTGSPNAVRLETMAPRGSTKERILESLQRIGYAAREIPAENGTCIFARKGTIRRWGSLVTHLGILFIFLGVIAGHLPGMGFQGFTLLSPSLHGGAREFRDPPFTLRLIETGARFNEKGRPLDYFSTVEILEEGRKVIQKTIRVNDPLEYRGIRFYQSTYGMLGFHLNVKDPMGTLHRVPVMIHPDGTAPADVPLQVGTTGIYMSLHAFAGDYDEKNKRPGSSRSYRNPVAVIFVFDGPTAEKSHSGREAGLISRERHFTFRDFDFSMGDLIPYTGLFYRKDPGVPLVWLGFMVTMAGVCISFYMGEKSITLLLFPGEKGECLLLKAATPLNPDYQQEYGVLKKCLEEV